MLTQEEKSMFSGILDTLGETLDISESQYDAIRKSYTAVGEWLAKPDSALAPYSPIIRPQGSFMLGTMIKAVNENDDLDIDLVCELTGKNPSWTQYNIKQAVGFQLKTSATYSRLLDKEGRRCWTLNYAESLNYHMDVLPSIVSNDYDKIVERAFSARVDERTYDSLAIRITDNKHPVYFTDIFPENWLKSNPFGYGRWFFHQAEILSRETRMFSNSVSALPKYSSVKLPLQRVVQLLKRHRDVMFDGNEEKPISIIITTLAAKAYRKEESIWDALVNIISNMEKGIDVRFDGNSGRWIKWISNPVNSEENFADKWSENPQKEKNFYLWLEKVKQDIQNLSIQRGIYNISDAMKPKFGEKSIIKTFSLIGERNLKSRQNGELKMSGKSGILSAVGVVTVPHHNFHGNE